MGSHPGGSLRAEPAIPAKLYSEVPTMKVKIESVKVSIERELTADQAAALGLIDQDVELTARELDKVASFPAIEDHSAANGADDHSQR